MPWERKGPETAEEGSSAGLGHAKEGRYEQAIKAFEQAVRLNLGIASTGALLALQPTAQGLLLTAFRLLMFE
jgi:tetratricopeptide (TPR) repeat protein